MLRLEEALERVLSAVRLMPEERVPLSEAHGRILAVDVTSQDFILGVCSN